MLITAPLRSIRTSRHFRLIADGAAITITNHATVHSPKESRTIPPTTLNRSSLHTAVSPLPMLLAFTPFTSTQTRFRHLLSINTAVVRSFASIVNQWLISVRHATPPRSPPFPDVNSVMVIMSPRAAAQTAPSVRSFASKSPHLSMVLIHTLTCPFPPSPASAAAKANLTHQPQPRHTPALHLTFPPPLIRQRTHLIRPLIPTSPLRRVRLTTTRRPHSIPIHRLSPTRHLTFPLPLVQQRTHLIRSLTPSPQPRHT